jgi:hypothetical protein
MCEERIGYLCDDHHRKVQPYPIYADVAGVASHNTTPPLNTDVTGAMSHNTRRNAMCKKPKGRRKTSFQPAALLVFATTQLVTGVTWDKK